MQKIQLSDTSKRKLEDTYLVIYAIKNNLNIKKNEIIEKVDFYSLVGLNIKGTRQLLSIVQDKPQENRFWIDIFEEFKSRGIRNILFFTIDDNKNIRKALKISFPQVTIIDSFTFIVPKFYKHCSEKSSRTVAGRLHELFVQNSPEEYKIKLNLFRELYPNNIHNQLIEKYLSNLELYYKYSLPIRKLLFVNGSNTRIYDKIRLNFDERKEYIMDVSEIYTLLDGVEKIFGCNSFSKRDWTSIIDALILLFPNIDLI